MKIGFAGLGVMGFPMAGHLARAGLDITAFNRTRARAEQWQAANPQARIASSLAELTRDADVVFTCVGNDDDIREVVTGKSGMAPHLKSGAIIVDHSTVSADVTRELSAILGARGIYFVDAPVSGGQQGAERGALTVMCGGDEDAFARVAPLISCYSRECRRMGSSGAGQLTKMVNQICVAGLIQGLAEGLRFAENAGLDAHDVIDVISKGAAQSWQMEHRHKTMLAGEFNHGFAVDWMRKDLAICLSEARRNGSNLPVTALIDQFYALIQATGGGRLDTSSLILNLAKANQAD